MTDMTRRFLLPLSLAALLLVPGCNRFRTDTYTYGEAVLLTEGRGDALNMDIALEYPVAGAPEDVLTNMRRAILTVAFDMDIPESASIDEAVTQYVDNLTDEYFAEYGDLAESLREEEPVGDVLRSDDYMDWPYTWEDRINGYYSGEYKNFRSYLVEYSSYRGGAHSLMGLAALVLENETGNPVAEEDFFADGYQDGIAALMQRRLLESDPDIYTEVLDPETLAPNGNFKVSASCVTWFFQPYEIAPYSVGLISVDIPWDELTPYLAQ